MQPKSLFATSAGPTARFKWVLHVLRPVNLFARGIVVPISLKGSTSACDARMGLAIKPSVE